MIAYIRLMLGEGPRIIGRIIIAAQEVKIISARWTAYRRESAYAWTRNRAWR